MGAACAYVRTDQEISSWHTVAQGADNRPYDEILSDSEFDWNAVTWRTVATSANWSD